LLYDENKKKFEAEQSKLGQEEEISGGFLGGLFGSSKPN
jgi:hypothetical protein